MKSMLWREFHFAKNGTADFIVTIVWIGVYSLAIYFAMASPNLSDGKQQLVLAVGVFCVAFGLVKFVSFFPTLCRLFLVAIVVVAAAMLVAGFIKLVMFFL